MTGLSTDEALCIFLVGQPQVAHRLGLGAPTLTAGNAPNLVFTPPTGFDLTEFWMLQTTRHHGSDRR